MDKIISKYDYVNATEETESALQDDLHDLDPSELAESLKISDFRNIINIFIKKICVKEYIQKVPRYSPGTWMASMTMNSIVSLIEECIGKGTISEADCHNCLFDLLLAMLNVGPGSSHFEVIEKLLQTNNMNQYFQELKGEKLQQLVSALKEHKYIPEKELSADEYASLMGNHIPHLLKMFVEDRDDFKRPEIWAVNLDLYLFYLLHMKDVPEEIHEPLEYCGNVFWYLYDRNPYKGFPDVKIVQQHIKKISEFIFSPHFSRGKQPKSAADYVEYLCDVEGDKIEVLWPEYMSLFKALCLSESAEDMTNIIKNFKVLFDRLDDRTIKNNPKIFQSWAVNLVDILGNNKDGKIIDDVIQRMISDMKEKYKPTKGDEKYWYPLIKAIWAVPTKEMQYIVKDIIDEDKFRRMWEWKENIQEAKNLILVVEKLDLPTEGDELEERECNSHCGIAVEKLIESLQIVKQEHHIMAELGRMSLTHMEKRSILANYMVYRFADKLNFQKVQEVVPELVKRFVPLITDSDYPWHDSWCSCNGSQIFQSIVGAFKSGSDFPDEVNKGLITILNFCMGDDCELVSRDDGDPTVWSRIVKDCSDFITKHCEGGTGEVCIPILTKMLKFRNSDEAFLREACTSSMEIAGQNCPDVCANFFGPLLDWYIEEPNMALMSIFGQIVGVNPDALKSRLDKFIVACKNDSESYSVQASLFYSLSTQNPQMFNQKLVDMLMEHHYLDQQLRSTVLLVTMNVSKVNPQLFEKHINSMIDSKVTSMEQYSVNNTLVNVVKNLQKFKDTVFEYLMNVLKRASDETQIIVTITALQDLCVKYGPEMFGAHKYYFENRREKEESINIKGSFTSLIDQIEGRSLENVVQDVAETKEDVVKLDTRVTGTETAVGMLTVQVNQHDDDIQELGEGLDTVTQRVDFAEKDIEETKVKVEEIDNMTMTNAPRWSRDLTKLMNPTDEHDWRLIAQRLGYSNDDIRAWATQHDPCMAVLSEWYATHKTREATHAVLTALQEMNRMDGAAIVENAMKAVEEVVEDEEVDYPSPPMVFLSYQWGHQDEVKLIRNHLQMAGYECWMDIGQMGGGDKLFEKIDNGIRGAKVLICCVSEKYAKSPNCNREVSLAVSLGKPMIPLLMEQMSWPPKGSMGPIFSEYLFVRFFQRPGEETDDDRFWPVAKFQETLMQLNCYGILPVESLIEKRYKNWWIPVQEVIVIDKSKLKVNESQAKQKEEIGEAKKSPDVFLSYQWGKQKQIMALYQRLTGLGLSCWMDIYQMGGGDSLYEKIDSGVRGCKVVLTCITQKYSLSANCRREVSLADALQKPIIPLLLEKMDWPPSGPMSMVFTQLLYVNFYHNEEAQLTWRGAQFNELLQKIGDHIPNILSSEETNHNSDDTIQGKKITGHTEELETRPVSARPVNQRGRAGASGPQPTEKMPQRQSKSMSVTKTDVESTLTSTQQMDNKDQKTTPPSTHKFENAEQKTTSASTQQLDKREQKTTLISTKELENREQKSTNKENKGTSKACIIL